MPAIARDLVFHVAFVLSALVGRGLDLAYVSSYNVGSMRRTARQPVKQMRSTNFASHALGRMEPAGVMKCRVTEAKHGEQRLAARPVLTLTSQRCQLGYAPTSGHAKLPCQTAFLLCKAAAPASPAVECHAPKVPGAPLPSIRTSSLASRSHATAGYRNGLLVGTFFAAARCRLLNLHDLLLTWTLQDTPSRGCL